MRANLDSYDSLKGAYYAKNKISDIEVKNEYIYAIDEFNGLIIFKYTGPLPKLRWKARSVEGELAPPRYGLRLNGFLDDNPDSVATFAFDNVTLIENNDGTANLNGTIRTAEINDISTSPCEPSIWKLNVNFLPATGDNPDYTIDPGTEAEIVKRNNADDYVNLESHGPPFKSTSEPTAEVPHLEQQASSPTNT